MPVLRDGSHDVLEAPALLDAIAAFACDVTGGSPQPGRRSMMTGIPRDGAIVTARSRGRMR